ncbi:MAG: hypothetical protein KDA37_06085 [Planctomycetales bacterium]|nr:hypothetical protein [Planctomycetales bacterium]
MNRTCMLFLLPFLAPSGLADAALFYNLGDLAGGDFHSEANAISADGSTVVGFSKVSFTEGLTSYNNVDQAFRWSLGTGMIAMGDLSGGTFTSRANGVSGDGSVIVGNGNSASGQEAFRWTAGSGMTGIGDLTGGAFFSQANDVSADGNRIVGASESGNGLEAFEYTGGSGMLGIGDLPGDTFRSTATAISDNGAVIVGRSDSALSTTPSVDISFDEAFRFPVVSGSLTGLGVLDTNDYFCGFDCTGSAATAVSADGSIVVGWSTDDVLPFLPFRWSAADGMTPLTTLYPQAVPLDITADGSVVVGTYNNSEAYMIGPFGGGDVPSAFIWTEADDAIDFQEYLLNEFGLDLPGWDLQAATGVSADGTVITGYGINPDGNREAWVVDLTAVPEPGALSLIALGGLSTLLPRGRRFFSA